MRAGVIASGFIPPVPSVSFISGSEGIGPTPVIDLTGVPESPGRTLILAYAVSTGQNGRVITDYTIDDRPMIRDAHHSSRPSAGVLRAEVPTGDVANVTLISSSLGDIRWRAYISADPLVLTGAAEGLYDEVNGTMSAQAPTALGGMAVVAAVDYYSDISNVEGVAPSAYVTGRMLLGESPTGIVSVSVPNASRKQMALASYALDETPRGA